MKELQFLGNYFFKISYCYHNATQWDSFLYVLLQASLKQLSLLPLIVDIVLVLCPTHLNNYNDHIKKNKTMTDFSLDN